METKISKTRIEKRLRKKTNPILVRAIIKLKKINPEIAKILAMPRKKYIKINLEYIEKKCKNGEKILIPGKVLGSGNLTKKIKIVAWSASKKALEKIKQSGSEFIEIEKEMKSNKLKELKILK